MMPVASKPKSALIKEGAYDAAVGHIKGLPNDSAPKRVAIGFKIEGCKEEIFKEYPYSFEADSTLRVDVETILGKQFTAQQAQDGVDLEKVLPGKPCRVVVQHRLTTGGKPKPVVSVVMAIPQAS